jgi:hypothetical protein
VEIGCERCYGPDAAAAWEAIQANRGQSLVEESHFGIHLNACDCGQVFAVVFTERIDWQGGDDPQDWGALPLKAAEMPALVAASPSELGRMLTTLGAQRRFLVRCFPADADKPAVWWRDGHFVIGPHD